MVKRVVKSIAKRLRNKGASITKSVREVRMDTKKINKTIDTILIVGSVGLAGSKLLELFPQYEYVVIPAILLAVLRLVR